MKKWLIGLLATLLFCMVGCGEAAPSMEPEAPPVLRLADFLTVTDVQQATGFAVDAPVSEADGAASYYAANGACVSLAMREMSAADFDGMLENFTTGGYALTDAPNLGDKAVWCEDMVELLVLTREYALDVRVEYAAVRPNDSLLAARQLAALLIEKL